MSFLTLKFIAFLIVAISIFYMLPIQYRKTWILVISYFFYGFNDVRMLWILFLITVNVWLFGEIISKGNISRRKGYYLLGVSINILILCCFKYLTFFIENINKLFSIFQLPINLDSPKLLLPLGLSFIVFQSTTYLGDVYYGRIEKVDLLSVACFVAFFPTRLSGPIQKARDLLPQLVVMGRWSRQKFIYGLTFLFVGYFEKIFVADHLATIIDPVFDSYQNHNSGTFVYAALLYSVQIYADFLAYSDMASGIAAMLGISVSKNFANPYMAESLVEFWKRWHISLNEWFVEYIYIPLGGSKRGKIRKYLNTFIVFIISGLWHGAQWKFVIWGGLNGLLQIIGELLRRPKEIVVSYIVGTDRSVILSMCRRCVVFIIISMTWVFFRMPNLETALHALERVSNQSWLQIFDTNWWNLFGTIQSGVGTIIGIIIFFKLQILRREEEKIVNILCKEPILIQYCVYTIAWVVILICICQRFANPNNMFIYFQF